MRGFTGTVKPRTVQMLLIPLCALLSRHLAVGTEVVYTSRDPVAVRAYPHIGVLVHFAAAGIEKVIVVADLCEALSAYAIRVIIVPVTAADKACLDRKSVV